jgi:hypothetical protein
MAGAAMTRAALRDWYRGQDAPAETPIPTSRRDVILAAPRHLAALGVQDYRIRKIGPDAFRADPL